MNKVKITFGNPEAQQKFVELHSVFLNNLDNLKNAFQLLVSGLAGKESDTLGNIIYYLGYIAWEDFNEILILSANGLESGAQKILRGMFERAVTAGYLLKHPEEAELFWNYHWVDARKFVGGLEKEFPDVFSKDKLEEIESEYQRVNESFQIPICRVCKAEGCKECKGTRTNHTWSKKDIVTMAKEVGMPLHIIKGAYYSPMMESHPKVSAIINRIRAVETGSQGCDVDGTSLIIAHATLLMVAEVLCEHFKIDGMRELINNANEDYRRAWKEKAERAAVTPVELPHLSAL